MAFITAVTDVQDSTGKSVVVQNPDGTRPPLAIRLGAGLTAAFSTVGPTGIVTVSSQSGAATLPLAVGFFDSSTGPAGGATLLPSADFPGASHVTFSGIICTTAGGSTAPAWAATTAYSSTTTPPSIVSHNGVLYVCTTSGTSGSTGPSGLGTGIVDGTCVWRAATAILQLIDLTAGLSPIATLTTSYPLLAGAASIASIELTADVTSALLTIPARHLLFVAAGGDPADTSSYTAGICLGAKLIFT